MKTMIITYFMIKNDNWLKKKNHTKNTHHATIMFYSKNLYENLCYSFSITAFFVLIQEIKPYHLLQLLYYCPLRTKNRKIKCPPKSLFPNTLT